MYRMTNINNALHLTNDSLALDFVKTILSCKNYIFYIIMNYCYKLVLDYS